MAKKVTEYFKGKGVDIELDATLHANGEKAIKNKEFDLYLISPQAKMYYEKFKKYADEVGRPIVLIPIQAYAPIPMGIEKLAKVVEENIG